MFDHTQITRRVRFGNEIWDIVQESDRNKTPGEALPGVKLLGTILLIRNPNTGEETSVYPWDVWGLEPWENLDGSCDESKVPDYYKNVEDL